MRPVRRNNSPQATNFNDYADAKPHLIGRISKGKNVRGLHLASYCSYCERPIPTSLAVEHIEPKKGPFGKPQLETVWTNFLLACVNCNSTKGDKQVIFSDLFFPDRDNTFFAFEYKADGTVIPNPSLSARHQITAKKTLDLCGLRKKKSQGKKTDIALERVGQRMQIWGQAEDSLVDYRKDPANNAVVNGIVNLMVATGFFSVWMAVFDDIPEMKVRFIQAISGTEESGCFDMADGSVISPHPNADNLQDGGKI
ncbi:hypothetical protein EI16_10065 [Hydrogenovibrio marinus]|uniref:HNH domain-containing protein n=1 Tax=Hydrogenovibrio marinus TaxID=28885 RepID=A0A066ZWD5_HYDMR|nr:hypothetical protein EI16_10065 [Hydrogenovibrio marinus]